MERHILGSIERELQSHIVERPCYHHSTLEVHSPALLSVGAHRGPRLLSGCDVQFRVHHISRELYVAAVLYGEGLERNHRQGVFHLTVAERILAREAEFVERVVSHTQVAASHKVDIVGVVGIEITHHVGSLVHSHRENHVETRQRRMLHGLLSGVAEIGEFHQFVHLVVGGQRRVSQYIRHIGGTEHVEPSAHHQIVEFSAHRTVEVDIRLAVCHAAVVLL